MARLRIILYALFAIASPQANADGAFKLPLCEDDRARGWAFYCTPPEPEPKRDETVPAESAAPPEEAASPEPADPKAGPATQAMMEFRAMVDEVKYRAVLDPTPENVQAYMELNKQIADQAGRFTDQWQRVLFETPHLNANVDYPLASAGIGVYQDQLKAAREASLRRVAASQGIMFIFDGSARCGICRVQGEVLAAMQEIYGISVLAVSRDGAQNESFPNAVTDDGRLTEMGLSDYPAPTIALVNPSSKEVQVIGSGLLTADQILERIYVVTEIPVGERY